MPLQPQVSFFTWSTVKPASLNSGFMQSVALKEPPSKKTTPAMSSGLSPLGLGVHRFIAKTLRCPLRLWVWMMYTLTMQGRSYGKWVTMVLEARLEWKVRISVTAISFNNSFLNYLSKFSYGNVILNCLSQNFVSLLHWCTINLWFISAVLQLREKQPHSDTSKLND